MSGLARLLLLGKVVWQQLDGEGGEDAAERFSRDWEEACYDLLVAGPDEVEAACWSLLRILKRAGAA